MLKYNMLQINIFLKFDRSYLYGLLTHGKIVVIRFYYIKVKFVFLQNGWFTLPLDKV